MFGTSAKLHWENNPNPNSLGAYPHLLVGVKATQFNALVSSLKRLHFAGKAPHYLYLATVHSACLTGKKAAQVTIIK